MHIQNLIDNLDMEEPIIVDWVLKIIDYLNDIHPEKAREIEKSEEKI